MRCPTFISGMLSIAAALNGQDVAVGAHTLNFDTSELRVAITMDRAEYLPGEAAAITLEVSNPGDTSVTGLTTFTSATSCVYLSWKVGDEFHDEQLPLCSPHNVDQTTLKAFAPSERDRRTYHSYDNLLDIGPRFLPGGGVGGAGIYRLNYMYGTAVANTEFTVVAAKLEAKTSVRLKDEPSREDPTQMLRKYVYVVALRAGNLTYICVGQSATEHDNEIFRNEDGSFNPVGVGPFKRLATSEARVVSLAAAVDADEDLTIEWTDAVGGRQTLQYREGYPAWRSRMR